MQMHESPESSRYKLAKPYTTHYTLQVGTGYHSSTLVKDSFKKYSSINTNTYFQKYLKYLNTYLNTWKKKYL
jgi:hypothetical protein